MTAASLSPGSERRSSPCPPPTTPSSSATINTTPSSPTPVPHKSRIFTLLPQPSRAHSQKVHRKRDRHDDSELASDNFGTETQQDSGSLRAAYQLAFRRASERAMTMPSSRTSKKSELFRTVSPTATRRALSRRSPSLISSASSSSPDRPLPSTSNAGIGRKVAASLDLFKETAPGPSQEKDEDAFDLPRPESSSSRRRGGGPPGTQVGEAQFEFVKRSDWPDREAAAIRREKSTTGLDRVRTRDSTGSVSSPREQDFRKRKERTLSRRETVLNDLVQWRTAVEAGRQDDGRGRPRERSVWIEDAPTPSPDVDTVSPGSEPSSLSSASTFHQESRSTQSPVLALHPPSPSLPSNSHEPHEPYPSPVPAVSPLDLHETPPARRGPTRLRSPPQTLAEAPLPPSLYVHSFGSPWSTDDDDDDDESAWETGSVTTTTSTTSASSPFPLSPSRTSPHPQPRVHNPSDEDEDRHRALLSPYEMVLTDGESSTDIAGHSELFGLSQESLPHIPLRPFRNQVGGHSAIYKFTKRAVCKVRNVTYLTYPVIYPDHTATRFSREFVLRGRRARSSAVA